MQAAPRRMRTTQEAESGDGRGNCGPLQEDQDDEKRLHCREHRLQVCEALHRPLH